MASAPEPTLSSTPCFRVLIVGVTSYLGSVLAVGLRDRYEVYGTYFSTFGRVEGVTTFALDVQNTGAILDTIRRIEPDVVFYCAGPSVAGFCEENRDTADSLLIKAPSLFFRVPARPFHFIYFSPAEILSDHAGGSPPFDETATPHPVNHFGHVKTQAENVVLSQGRQTHVFRLGTVFGETAGAGARFRSCLHDDFARSLIEKRPIPMSRERRRSFLYAGELARAMRAFLERLPEASSLYHLCAPESCSPYDFGVSLARSLGQDEALIRADEATTVPLPKDSTMTPAKFEAAFNFRFARLRDAIGEMSERLQQGRTGPWV